MTKIWRRTLITVVAASGLATFGIGSAIAQPTTGPVITISAKSLFKPVSHDVFVLYRGGKASHVSISGSITGATTGEVATLYAQSFPYKHAAAPVAGQSVTLNPTDTNPIPYSFRATPSLATKYTVEVFPNATATSPVGQSPVQSVYVVASQPFTGLKKCHRPVCHETIHVFTLIPASAYKLESSKKWFFYFGLRLHKITAPPFPKFLSLDRRAAITKAKRVSGTDFERTISFSFRIGNNGYAFSFNFCSKDTEAKDGINLPGHHNCGAKRVLRTAYLG
jgi:hypothetical protein